MDRDDLFLVLEHINEYKNNQYRKLRNQQIGIHKNDKKQLSLLEKSEAKNKETIEKAKLKIVN